MDAILTVIAVLGLGALLIAMFVFTAAARRYVTGETQLREQEALASDLSPYRRSWVKRSPQDRRRRKQPTSFPLEINGVYITAERRINPDRRRSA